MGIKEITLTSSILVKPHVYCFKSTSGAVLKPKILSSDLAKWTGGAACTVIYVTGLSECTGVNFEAESQILLQCNSIILTRVWWLHYISVCFARQLNCVNYFTLTLICASHSVGLRDAFILFLAWFAGYSCNVSSHPISCMFPTSLLT